MYKLKKSTVALLSTIALSTTAWGQNPLSIEVNAKKSTASVNPDMYGIFFEDINFGADGGLYAELIKNRSFEFPQNLMGWNTFGKTEIRTDQAPFKRAPHYVRLSPSGHPHKHTGLENEGFRGIGILKDAEYRFSVWGRMVEAGKNGEIRIELIDSQNNPFARQEIEITSDEWKLYEIKIKAPETESKASLRIFLSSDTPIDLEHISLFPTDTWKGRKNGLRKDLAQALYDLHPGVFRFPGGCIVEGTDLATRYNWKNSIGPVENRPLNENRWQYTFTDHFFPDYYQTYGMGFFELFQLAEDIGASPLPVLNCGMACQYQNNGGKSMIDPTQLDPYIQDALDLIEFANGDPSTQWGKIRAEMGHPESFNLKYLAIGNEQWGKEYSERLDPFIKAIKAKYPEIEVVGSAGPVAGGEGFDFLWQEMKRLKVDLVDEHYYMAPEWFYANTTRYDQYDRKGPKVFAGEFAAHAKDRSNSLNAALAEAAFMTGIERNADIVRLATYAPLFAHVDAWQWKPDMIWFDNLNICKTPNYYVQQLYASHKGTHVLSITSDKKTLTGQNGVYASAVIDRNKQEVILKLVNSKKEKQVMDIVIKGIKEFEQLGHQWLTLEGEPEICNSIDNPNKITIQEKEVPSLHDKKLSITASPYSLNVIRLKIKN